MPLASDPGMRGAKPAQAEGEAGVASVLPETSLLLQFHFRIFVALALFSLDRLQSFIGYEQLLLG